MCKAPLKSSPPTNQPTFYFQKPQEQDLPNRQLHGDGYVKSCRYENRCHGTAMKMEINVAFSREI